MYPCSPTTPAVLDGLTPQQGFVVLRLWVPRGYGSPEGRVSSLLRPPVARPVFVDRSTSVITLDSKGGPS